MTLDRRRRLLNEAEEATQGILDDAVQEYGARVHAKVRIADALDIEKSGLTRDEYSYALKAHLDLVVTDRNGNVAFAVEFDGRQHETDPVTIARDALKNSVAEKLDLSLLRIDDAFFRRVERFSILGWLTSVWFMNDDFARQQEAGSISPDEVFHYGFVLAEFQNGKPVSFPLDPFIRSRASLQRWQQQGSCRQRFPSRPLAVRDPKGYAVDVRIVDLPEGRVIIGVGRCRIFNFGAVHAFELAEELAVYDAAAKMGRYMGGGDESVDPCEAEGWLARLEQWSQYR